MTVILFGGIWLLYWKVKKELNWFYALVIGSICAITYAYNMNQAPQPYSGLLSDQTFQTAFIRSLSDNSGLHDWYDSRLPTHYPPLYFITCSVFVRLFGLSAIEAAIILPCILLFILPIIFYLTIYYLFNERYDKNQVAAIAVVCLFGFGSYSTSFILSRSAGFGIFYWICIKPYEVLAALLTLSWLVVIIFAIEKQVVKGIKASAVFLGY